MLKMSKNDFQTDSAIIDQHLGFRVVEIELALLEQARAVAQSNDIYSFGKALHDGHQTWIGLDPQTLQTPYSELSDIVSFIVNKLMPVSGSKFVDLGAGYGRLGFVLQQLAPEINFMGFEYVAERVAEGSRILKLYGCDRAGLYTQDILQKNFTLPDAQFFFIYDFGFPAQIRELLKRLESIAQAKDLIVVARGKGIRSQIHQEHLWLGGVYKPWHQENFSIYSNYCELGA